MTVSVDNPFDHGEDPWGREECGPPDTLVSVGGVFIPTTYVQTTVAEDGVTDVVRLTEVKFPTEMDGMSVVDHIDAFEPSSQSEYDVASVYYKDRVSGGWFLEQKGWVRGVGPTNEIGEGKMWVDDPSNLLTGIPFSRAYSDATLGTVLRDVRDEFEEYTIFDSVEVDASGLDLLFLDDENFVESGLENIFEQKSFTANRHTLVDALNWATSSLHARAWFEPLPDRLVLVFDIDFGVSGRFVDQTIEDPNSPVFKIIENDAIDELRPLNAVTVNGSSKVSVAGFTIRQLESGSFPQVSVQHTPLVERTGQMLPGQYVDSGTTTIEQTENYAKKELKTRLTGTGEGDILGFGRPDILVGDRLTARPFCQSDVPTTDVPPPLDYEIQQIQHECESGVYTTRVNVHVWVDADDIDVVESGMKET